MMINNIVKQKIKLSLILYFIFFLIIEFFSIKYKIYGGLDTKLGYTTKFAYDFLTSLKQEGRNHYLIILYIDFFYLLTYTFVFHSFFDILLIKINLSKINNYNLFPFIPGFFDIIENILLITIITKYPNQFLKSLKILSYITIIKWIFVIINISLIIILLIYLLIKRFNKNTSKTRN